MNPYPFRRTRAYGALPFLACLRHTPSARAGRVVALSAVLLAACAPPATAVTVQGRLTFIDGDSFKIGATEVRLFGVDAPEGRQTCRRAGREWACGDAAAARLREIAGTSSVTCTQRDVDNYGRMVAVCTIGARDLGRELVRSGFALAYRQYSDDYAAEEAEARAARRGLWAGEFEPPWEWRRTNEGAAAARPSQPTSAPGTGRPGDSASPRAAGPRDASPRAASPRPGCRIKGNINREGERIYHEPGSSSYEQTEIDEARDERWFCSADEARRAGWRAPRG